MAAEIAAAKAERQRLMDASMRPRRMAAEIVQNGAELTFGTAGLQ